MNDSIVCALCHFAVALDDVVIGWSDRRHVICLRCYDRETDNVRIVSDRLRRDVADALYEAATKEG